MTLMYKPRCILHIGMPKTGSSSIQFNLSKQVANADFEYVKLSPDGNSSQIIYSLFSEQPEFYHGNQKSGFSKDDLIGINKNNLRKLTGILKNTKSNMVIISAEDISALTEAELNKLKLYLMEYCESVCVIGYVRPFVEYMQSALQQVIKDGLKNFILDNLYPKYRDVFEKFDKVFGEDNVVLVKFDHSILLENDVVLDFCHRIGITINLESIVRENQSISLEAAALLYIYHHFGFGYGCGNKVFHENALLIEAISKISGKKISFASFLINQIQEKYSDDIKWIETRIGVALTNKQSKHKHGNEGISSVKDLIAIGLENSDKLKKLIFQHIQEKEPTPQNVVDWMHLLRVELSNSENEKNSLICSSAQLEQSMNLTAQLSDVLKKLFITLFHGSDTQGEIVELRKKAIHLFQIGIESIDYKEKIAFSVDVYSDDQIMGWVFDSSNPIHKFDIEFYCIYGKIGEGVADEFREDLVNQVSEDGCCAFRIRIEEKLNTSVDQIIMHLKGYNKYFYINMQSIKT